MIVQGEMDAALQQGEAFFETFAKAEPRNDRS
jgi:hypothetical protein